MDPLEREGQFMMAPWLAGAEAAGRGMGPEDCPWHGARDERRAWLGGMVAYYARMEEATRYRPAQLKRARTAIARSYGIGPVPSLFHFLFNETVALPRLLYWIFMIAVLILVGTGILRGLLWALARFSMPAG